MNGRNRKQYIWIEQDLSAMEQDAGTPKTPDQNIWIESDPSKVLSLK